MEGKIIKVIRPVRRSWALDKSGRAKILKNISKDHKKFMAGKISTKSLLLRADKNPWIVNRPKNK